MWGERRRLGGQQHPGLPGDIELEPGISVTSCGFDDSGNLVWSGQWLRQTSNIVSGLLKHLGCHTATLFERGEDRPTRAWIDWWERNLREPADPYDARTRLHQNDPNNATFTGSSRQKSTPISNERW
jgi:hypothetical protein